MRSSKFFFAGPLGLVLFLSVACGSGDAGNDAGESFAPQVTEAVEDSEAPTDQGNSGFGSGTGTIGDDSWTFVIRKCFFPGEFMDPTVVFMMSGTAEMADGGQILLKVTIGDSTRPGEDITHHAMVFFGGDADNEPFRWLASTKISLDDEGFVRIDGKHVTVETTFDKDLTGEKEEVPGKLEGTCP